jgi:hypothetical protein
MSNVECNGFKKLTKKGEKKMGIDECADLVGRI